ncbi:phosphonate ABC transporter, permease protein PhnE [Phenylobacterium sp.]|uniref:phosphonate ABC transporter, permease protein PhnE n=1 Tax=Phenylobacterium sp. TaxID=1871053 RepID=UPI0025D2CA44|nr:phosphonate ABC transporter, permease protein PhnE [Phenylobacterium sp.]
MSVARESAPTEAASNWRFPASLRRRGLAGWVLLLAVVLASAPSVEAGRMFRMTGEAATAMVTGGRSQVLDGLGAIGRQLVPLQISERREVSRIEDFDPNRLPPFSRIETVETRTERLDPETLQMKATTERTAYLVEPVGYLAHVGVKLWETLMIAFWGTLLAVLMSAPLAFFSARNLTPSPVLYGLARGIVSLLRAVPELVSALFLVVAYGFGPIAGVLALALHGAGFLGKFYAEDVEAADPKPQEALAATGANRLKVLRFAILPQVLPQYIGYTLYVLDRNFRMATVVGLVGAGGIGQELKGRFDMYNYHHVGTILVAMFATVFLIDQVSARMRRAHF